MPQLQNRCAMLSSLIAIEDHWSSVVLKTIHLHSSQLTWQRKITHENSRFFLPGFPYRFPDVSLGDFPAIQVLSLGDFPAVHLQNWVWRQENQSLRRIRDHLLGTFWSHGNGQPAQPQQKSGRIMVEHGWTSSWSIIECSIIIHNDQAILIRTVNGGLHPMQLAPGWSPSIFRPATATAGTPGMNTSPGLTTMGNGSPLWWVDRTQVRQSNGTQMLGPSWY